MHRARGDRVALDMALLTVDPSQLSELVAAALPAHEHFDLAGRRRNRPFR